MRVELTVLVAVTLLVVIVVRVVVLLTVLVYVVVLLVVVTVVAVTVVAVTVVEVPMYVVVVLSVLSWRKGGHSCVRCQARSSQTAAPNTFNPCRQTCSPRPFILATCLPNGNPHTNKAQRGLLRKPTTAARPYARTHDMVVSLNMGTPKRPQNTMILLKGTPKKVPSTPYLGKLPYQPAIKPRAGLCGSGCCDRGHCDARLCGRHACSNEIMPEDSDGADNYGV